MDSVESRLTRLETWRQTDVERFDELKGTVNSIDGKVDQLLARNAAASGVKVVVGGAFRGAVPALWLLAASGLVGLLGLHFVH